MPKMKTKRGAAKRFRTTASSYKRKGAFKSHILTKMTTKRKRKLRDIRPVSPADQALVRRMLRD